MIKRIASIIIGSLMVFGLRASAETTIEPTVLVDQDGILITATELECEGIKGELKLDIENNSDKDVSIIAGSMGFNQNAINNYMTNECYVNVDVSSGKKAKETVKFGAWYNAYMDFTDIASITMAFQVNDDDYNILFYSEPVEIKTSAYASYDFADNPFVRGIQDNNIQKYLDYKLIDFKEGELFSADGIKINNYAVLTKDGEIGIYMEVENTTDSIMGFCIDGLYVNGINVYYGNWCTEMILPHTKNIMDISIDDVLDSSYGNAVVSKIEQASIMLVTEDSEYNIITNGVMNIIGDESDYEIDVNDNELYNANDIQIIAKDVVESRFDNGDKIFVALVKNDNDYEIILKVKDDISVNDYMIDTTSYPKYIPKKSIGIFYFQLDGDSLEDCNIASFDKVEGIIEIKDERWNVIDNVSVETSF